MLELGIFDHLDHNGTSLAEQLEDRLKLIGLLEAEGYFAYHLAEHHSTPLGMAPSPSVFLAAVAQRTRKIKFGPLVYVLPLHHPLRLYEEICMLDHLSGGRLQLGVGRGGALLEHLPKPTLRRDASQTRPIGRGARRWSSCGKDRASPFH